jgi:hypothetical protein
MLNRAKFLDSTAFAIRNRFSTPATGGWYAMAREGFAGLPYDGSAPAKLFANCVFPAKYDILYRLEKVI